MIERLRKFNWLMFAAMLGLIAVGTIAVRSAGNARAETVFHGLWLDHLETAIAGLFIYLVLSFVDYRKLLDFLSVAAYVIATALLAAVLVSGSSVYGGKRWLWFFQPSEIAKPCLVMLVAWLFGGRHGDWAHGLWTQGFRGFLLATAVVGIPCLLIWLEPDLGTMLTLVPAMALMLFAAGVWRRGIVVLLAAGALGAIAILGSVYEMEKPGVDAERREQIRRYLPLKQHQIERVRVFLFPEADIVDQGYNLRQAKISIGSGGLSGKGIGKGEANHLSYLPQAISMNDFIFCVWAEETGYHGSLLLLGLYLLLLLPGCWIAFFAADRRGRLLALGTTSILFVHVFVNLAMSIGLVPITGLPLPFVSAGRTFLLMTMCGLGLVQSVSVHRT